jgi:hypothetical protein
MKNIEVRISTKLGVIVGAVVLFGVVGSVAFAYKEMSNMRRDLYGLRDNYYGTGDGSESNEFEEKRVDVKILSQEVKKLRVATGNYEHENGEEEYAEKDIRTVLVELKNNKDAIFSYFGSIGYIDGDGLVQRSVTVHEDDQANKWVKNYGSLSLAPGASIKISLYFEDTGQEITELIDADKDEFGYTQYTFSQ